LCCSGLWRPVISYEVNSISEESPFSYTYVIIIQQHHNSGLHSELWSRYTKPPTPTPPWKLNMY
jgi:hypothetical protein